MAVPKSKITKSKQYASSSRCVILDAYVEDKVTGELHRPLTDLKTGMYRGKQVLKLKNAFNPKSNLKFANLCGSFCFVIGVKRNE